MKHAKYRHKLPQLNGHVLLTDGGLETVLIFHEGYELPDFASFTLLQTQAGRDRLKAYYIQYAEIALKNGQGFVLESPTWRASPDWGSRLGYSPKALAAANREAIEMLFEVRETHERDDAPLVISGNIGPRGDGYNPDRLLQPAEAEAYHSIQIRTLAHAGVDMILAATITHVGEAIGIARACAAVDVPCAISFTVETDGRLPTGQPLGEAIEEVDAATNGAPAYFMINCAHPTHITPALEQGAGWLSRVRGLRANASRMSHEELDNAEELDDGNPQELGAQYRELMDLMPTLSVLGGCCGTDHRHVEAIGAACGHRRIAA